MKARLPARSLLLAALALAALGAGPPPAVAPAPEPVVLRDVLGDPASPDDFWRASTPDAEGLDAAKLEAAVRAIEARGWAIHSFLVARHGRLVLERYGADGKRQLGPGDPHALHSTTKTFTGTLVGIALEEGKLASVDAPVLGFFAADEVKEHTPGKLRMRLEDLLTMRSGLDYLDGVDDYLFGLPETAAEILSQHQQAEPGTRWNYSSADSHVLAEILRRATGEPPRAYAERRLFGKLGITQVRWDADPDGTSYGGFGLWLRPRDLARFGQLLLSRGRWKGAQVVPAEWIAAITRPRAETPWSAGTYGYQCWLPKIGGFATRGYMGQDMYVFPDRDLIVVFTAALPYQQADELLDGLVKEFVLGAVRE
jgi:CubicO group peptidase (beta-lactamase class C family)